jgi:penicillin amidase
MKLTSREILTRLGRGEAIAAVCTTAGLSRSEFDAWWRDECRRRVPAATGSRRSAGLAGSVRLQRDRWGIPHVYASSDGALFFGLGYAVAQDRLFQLDYLRRKARGRLAEVLGPEAVESDLLYRTVGIGAIAEREWGTLPAETQQLLTSYTAGINALIDDSRAQVPIEFDLLDYRPEPWTPVDSLAILGEFRWYLTGRFPVITVPELVKRAVGSGALYRSFLEGEADDECMLQRGDYTPGALRTEVSGGGPEGGPGSNNWVLSARRTTTGQPLLASDPHIPFGAVSIWHEVHLDGGSFRVTGVALAGVPAVMIGRTERVAWGITNNICSQRDLYQEKTDPAHPGCFLFDGTWEPAREREEIIRVRDAEPIRKKIRSSRHGPIVDDIMPPATRKTGPVSLRWLGAEPCGWLTAMLGMNRARAGSEFRAATRPWLVPTFSLVFADADGHVGYHCAGRIPRRRSAERGYRDGSDPRQVWDGLLAFEAMPHLDDPARGYFITANNRVAAEDYPQPLSGTFASGHRARRIREMIEASGPLSRAACQALQQDIRSGRAAGALPGLLATLEGSTDPRVGQAIELLRRWDLRVAKDSVGAALFNVFFAHWCRAVVAIRLPADEVTLVATLASPLAARLLTADAAGWFAQQDRHAAIRTAFAAALAELTAKLGPNMDGWTWGRLHTLNQRHFLSARGELGQLLDRSGLEIPGEANTVNSATPDPDHRCSMGAGFRMVADLADPGRGIWAVEIAGASGHPGSPHYDDQLAPWSQGQYHYIPLAADVEAVSTLLLEPER